MNREDLREKVREAVGLNKPGIGRIYYPEDLDAVIRVVLEAAAGEVEPDAAVARNADVISGAVDHNLRAAARRIRSLLPEESK